MAYDWDKLITIAINKLLLKGRKNWTEKDKANFENLFIQLDYKKQEQIEQWEFESPNFHLSKNGI